VKLNLPHGIVKAPSASTIGSMLKKHFKLEYMKFKAANYRYRDPTYNEKRQWISRLLAQFLYDNAALIAIDESGFRSDTVKDM
jgi:hypothetical protein